MSAVERHPAIAVAHGRRRSSSRHRFGTRLPLSPRLRRRLAAASPALSLAPAVLATLLVQSLGADGSAVPSGAARFDVAGSWAAPVLGAVAGLAAPFTAAAWVQLGALQRVLGGGSVQSVLGATHGALLLLALLSVVLLWLVLRRTGSSPLAAGAAAAAFGIAPQAVAVHAQASAADLAVPWLLAAALCATRRYGVAAPLAAGAMAAVAVVTSPLALIATPLVAALESAAPRRAVRAVEEPQEHPRRRVALAGAGFAGALVIAALLTLVLALLPATRSSSVLSEFVDAARDAVPIPSGGAAALASWVVADPLSLVIAVVALVTAAVRPGTRPIAAVGAALLLLSFWPAGRDAVTPAGLLLVVAAVAVARAVDAAVVTLGHPVFRVSVIGAGWLMGVAALLVVAVAIWIAGIAGAAHASVVPEAQAQRWVHDHAAAGRTVLVDVTAWPGAQGAIGTGTGWYATAASRGPAASSIPWSKADYVVTDAALLRTATGSARTVLDRAHVLASFGSGASAVQVRSVPAPAASTTPSGTTEQVSPQVLAARRTAGAELAANSRLDVDAAGRALLVGGRVDARVSIALAQLLSGHRLTVSGFPAVTGESGGRRQVLISAVDGRSVATDSAAAGVVLRYFSALRGAFAVQRIDSGAGGILVTLPPDPTFLPAS